MHAELWTVIGLLLTNAGFLFGMWKYFDGRISRVYQRFDEHKESVESKFVRKDLCSMVHTNTADHLTQLESRIEKRFDKLELLVATIGK